MNLKSTLNYTEMVQTYLCTIFPSDSKVSEKCIIAVEAYVNVNRKRHFRIIALIRKRTSHAVAIFKARKQLNHNYGEIHILEVLPLNLEFKLDTDKARCPNDNFHPVVLSGEDFTLLDFDPLSSPCSSTNMERKDFNRKKFYLDFSNEDFHTFSIRLSNASQFIAKEEVFSSFDWLKKLKDEANSVSDIWGKSNNTESNNSESDKEFENVSPVKLSIPISISNRMVTSDICPVTQSNPIDLMCSESQVTADNTDQYSVIRRPQKDLHKLSDQTLLNNKCSERYQSSPDLMNGSYEDITDCPSALFNPSNDNRQSAYIENKLRQKEKDYCNWEYHNLFVGTWNVNGRVDDSLRLDDWLTPPLNVDYPAFYILGFQEIDLSIGSMALNRGNISNLEERWLKLIESSGPFRSHAYNRLYRSRLAGILMIVYIQRKLSKYVMNSHVLASKVPTGVLNVMGNKGGVGIRFRIFNSNLCFINCHLAAGESNRLRRDQDFREIEKNLVFFDELGKGISIYEHDLVFLMGDLNYRILNIDAAVVKDYAYNNQIEILLQNDEILNESKAVFKRFNEGKVTFLPTYKFDLNTDKYDTSEKNRVPSFCDRIMWTGDNCNLLDYTSHMSLKSSDHKPVSAFFNIGLKKIDFKKQIKVHEAIIRSMDLIYNLSLPQAKIDRQEINFENVHFYEHRQASISFTNTGQYEFVFNFKEIPGCPKIPDWLTVQPSEGTVKIEQNCELIFEIFINANNVSQLNTKSVVQCILILTLLGGKDYFITVSADLVPTSFGLPLSLLVSLKNPISTFSRKELYEKCIPYTKSESVSTQTMNEFTTPKEIFVMVDYLVRNIREEELFARPGSHSEIQSIREQLDVEGIKADFSTVCVHSVVEAMLMFLSALYFPIVPKQLLKECMSANGNLTESIKVISELPQDNRNLFHYLTKFLRKVLANRSTNGTDIRSLGILFVDIIFRPNNLDSSERDICSQFISQFIENDAVKYLNYNQTLR